MKKSGFIYGAIILAIVNFIVRLIGFSYKIILSKLIGPEGIGLFQMVFPVLMFFITFTTAGIPVAVSKLVAKQNSIGNSYGAKKVFKVAFIFTLISASFLSLVIILFGKSIAENILKNNDIYFSVLLTAPAVLIISLSSVMRGYFYGLKKVSPAGISQIIEQLTRIVFVLGFIYHLYPVSPRFGSIIAVLGISVGELFGLAWLVFHYRLLSHSTYSNARRQIKYLMVISKICYIAIPITISRIISVLMQLANAVLIPQRLMIAGYSSKEAVSIFGRVVGMSLPIIFLPFIVTSALVINIIPNLSEEIELKNYSMIKTNIALSLRITLLISIPLTLLYVFFSEPLAMFFYGDKAVGKYIGILGYSTIFISLQHTLSGILHGMGKQISATVNYIIGMSIQLFCTYFLVSNPSFGINGFFLGFLLSTFTICLLNYISLNSTIRIKISISDYIIKPIFASILTVFTIIAVYKYLTDINVKSYISFLTCLTSGGATYFGVLIITKGLPKHILKILYDFKR